MKKTTVFLLVLIFILLSSTAFADDSMKKARALYDMGIIRGTSNTFSEESLELDRNATRAEMCATVIRMLGKEEKANYQENPHPFKDVPKWASNSIGWLYENYIVSGGSATYFGANDIASVKQYSALLLRVLGFYESKGDFEYNNATKFAVNYGLLTEKMATQYELSRKTMIVMSYNALRAKIKNSNRRLIEKLCDEKAVDRVIAQNLGVLGDGSISEEFPDVPENLGPVSVVARGDKFRLTLENEVDGYGLRIFVREDGGTIKEITRHTEGIYFEKGPVSYHNGGAVGYLDTLIIHGLDTKKKYSFIVLKTSSESELYKTYGKSEACKNE